MAHLSVNWRMKTQRAALSALALPLAILGGSAAYAQSIMRTPSLHIDFRVPTLNPTVAPRVNPAVGTRVNTVVTGSNSVTIARMPSGGGGGITAIARTGDSGIARMGDGSIRRVGDGGGGISVLRRDGPGGIARIGTDKLPYARYSHNLYPPCEYARRGPDGECFDRPVVSTGGGGSGSLGQEQERWLAQQFVAAGCDQSAHGPERVCGGDRQRAVACAGRRAGAAVTAWSGSHRRRFRFWAAAPSACSVSSTAVRWTSYAANSPPTPA